MKKLLLSFLAISMSALAAQAFSIEALRFHCADDTTRINQILHEAVSNTSLKSAGSYMSFFADKLLGTPYVAHTLEGDREYLSIYQRRPARLHHFRRDACRLNICGVDSRDFVKHFIAFHSS